MQITSKSVYRSFIQALVDYAILRYGATVGHRGGSIYNSDYLILDFPIGVTMSSKVIDNLKLYENKYDLFLQIRIMLQDYDKEKFVLGVMKFASDYNIRLNQPPIAFVFIFDLTDEGILKQAIALKYFALVVDILKGYKGNIPDSILKILDFQYFSGRINTQGMQGAFESLIKADPTNFNVLHDFFTKKTINKFPYLEQAYNFNI